MSAEYYTPVSEGQINVLCALNAQKKIHVTKNMLNYLYSLSRQGQMYRRDNTLEEFRKAIVDCVGRAIKNRDANNETEYNEISLRIRNAFQILCASHTSRYLEQIENELDESDTSISQRQINVLYTLVSQRKISMTQDMIDYLYALGTQGQATLRDAASETFTKRIKECVSRAIQNREVMDQAEYDEISLCIQDAFRDLCKSHTSDLLGKIEKELQGADEKS